MSVNIEGLSSKELAELISRANQRKKVLAKRKPAAQVKAAVSKLLKASGWTFAELYGAAGAVPQRPRLRSRHASRPRAAPWARSPPSTATRPMPRTPGPAAASSRSGWRRKPPRAASWKNS